MLSFSWQWKLCTLRCSLDSLDSLLLQFIVMIVPPNKSMHWPLLAESGLLFQRFAENLTAAILPKAAAKLELRKTAAKCPKRTFPLPVYVPILFTIGQSGEFLL